MLVGSRRRPWFSSAKGVNASPWLPTRFGSSIGALWRGDQRLTARDSALFVAGSSEHFTHVGSAVLRGGSTWHRWGFFNLTNTGTRRVLQSCLSGNTGYEVEVTSGNVLKVTVGIGTSTVAATHGTTLSSATWYLWEANCDGTSAGIALNGGSFTTQALGVGASYSPGTAAWKIGATTVPDNYWNGSQEECGGGNTILTSGQRTTLYNSGNGVTYYDSNFGSSALFWFPLTEFSAGVGAISRVDVVGGISLTDTGTVASGDGKVPYSPTVDGTPVLTWTDGGLTALAPTQATYANRPTLKKGVINGHDALRGNGTSSTLKVATGTIATQPFWGWCVVDDNDAGTRYYFDGGAASKVALFHNGTNLNINAGSSVGAAHTAGAPHLVTFVVNGNSTQIFVDGTSLAGPSAGGAQGQNSGISLFATQTGASFLDGDMTELAFISGTPTTTDFANLKTYATGYYNLTVA